MDLSFSFSSDWVNLLAIPFILWTVKDVIAGWKGLWDDDLTFEDRQLLMRMVIFVMLPGVVFFHELGHYLAALSVGVPVAKFHYGPVMGYVETYGCTDPAKRLWIAFSGNLVQILIGLLSLVVAGISKSPPVVATAVYFGLYTVASTVVFYALLSLGGFYGDWIQMYTNSFLPGVAAIIVFQLLIIAGLAWAVYAPLPKAWFAEHTKSRTNSNETAGTPDTADTADSVDDGPGMPENWG